MESVSSGMKDCRMMLTLSHRLKSRERTVIAVQEADGETG